MAALPEFETLRIWVAEEGIGHLELNRPQQYNAMSETMWLELPKALSSLDDAGSRVIVVTGAGRNFCSGVDVAQLAQLSRSLSRFECTARAGLEFRRLLAPMQAAMSALEACRAPTLALVQGACLGAAVDLVTACDLRLCTADATFCVKEADLAIVADMGTLQRLPALVGHALAMELSLTARSVGGAEAERMGLVSACHADAEALRAQGLALARLLAAKSPVALAGVKRVLLHARDHPHVGDGLDFVATYNASALLSQDVQQAFRAFATKKPPSFSRL